MEKKKKERRGVVTSGKWPLRVPPASWIVRVRPPTAIIVTTTLFNGVEVARHWNVHDGLPRATSDQRRASAPGTRFDSSKELWPGYDTELDSISFHCLKVLAAIPGRSLARQHRALGTIVFLARLVRPVANLVAAFPLSAKTGTHVQRRN